MSSIDDYGETILRLSEFVKKLDGAVRTEAFKFLLEKDTVSVSKPATSRASIPALTHSDRPIAPQELIRRSTASKFTDKAIVLAYWLEKYKGQSTFSSGDLKAVFDQAREPSPKNPSDLVANLEVTGRVMRAEKSGSVQQYRLTSSAITEVEKSIQTERHST